jgi:hypothetical protein
MGLFIDLRSKKKELDNMAVKNEGTTAIVPKAGTLPRWGVLSADEIKVKLSFRGNGGDNNILLSPKVDGIMRILDECAPTWGMTLSQVCGNPCCTLFITDTAGTSIRRAAIGVGTMPETEKSAANDAFIRAAAMFGIGREVNYGEFAHLPRGLIDKNPKGAGFLATSYTLRTVEYGRSGRIEAFVLVNSADDEFTWTR